MGFFAKKIILATHFDKMKTYKKIVICHEKEALQNF